MKILFFLSHPAHFHLFKHIIKKLNNDGHETLILIKEKDILETLIQNEAFNFQNIQKKANKKRDKDKFSILLHSFWDLLKRDIKLYPFVKKFKPDLMIGCEPSIAHIGFLMRIPTLITVEDDLAVHPEFCYPTFPFASYILSPMPTDLKRFNRKKIGYEGYQKLAYLHPNYFTPDITKVSEIIKNNKPFFIIRLSALTASHDVNIQGLNRELVLKLIKILERKGNVYISSEKEMYPEFEKYRFNINLSNMHHALNYAELLISDSQSMSVEAAILGTPSVRFSDFSGRISVLEELEHKYELTYGILTNYPDKLIEKVEELLNNPDIKKTWQKRTQKMLSEKIDVTAFFVWFIENYPNSINTIQTNPQYQNKFF